MARKEIDNLKIKEKRKNDILKSALITFCKNSFEEVSIDQIAKLSSCSRTLIYYYYKTKEEIFIDLINNYLVSLTSFNEMLNSLNKEDAFIKVTNYLIDKINSDNAFFFKLIFLQVLLNVKDNFSVSLDKIFGVLEKIKLTISNIFKDKKDIYFALIKGLSLEKYTSNVKVNSNEILKLFT